MRWWLNTDPPKLFSVDNASVKGMDFSMLEPDVWMVHWAEGKGEIERQVDVDTNDNGLREAFIDVTPYAPLFQQFLRLCPLLTLEQAQKVQVDLINQLFDSKRQLPYHYPVAAGDYWWDASDETMFASTSAGLQNAIAKINEVVTRLNSLPTSINTGIVAKGNALTDDTNAGFTNVTNYINPNLVDVTNQNRTWMNNQILGSLANGGTTNTINDRMQGSPSLGLDGNIPGLPYSIASYMASVLTSVVFSNISWTPITPVSTSNVQWIPIGSSTPVTVTPAEQEAIMNGIAARTNQLTLVKNSKSAEVMALTEIDDVIDYDVTTGWPTIPLPPAFDESQLAFGMKNAMSFVIAGDGGGGGGIPEAPSDGVTYGRKDMTWNPALALSDDILDGGTF